MIDVIFKMQLKMKVGGKTKMCELSKKWLIEAEFNVCTVNAFNTWHSVLMTVLVVECILQ